MPQSSRDLLIAVVGLAVLLYAGIERCQRYSFLQRDRLPKWGEYGVILQRQQGPVRYVGGAHFSYGGFDVYEQGDRLWIVGPGRRFTPCRPEEAVSAMDRLVREESHRRGPPDGWHAWESPDGELLFVENERLSTEGRVAPVAAIASEGVESPEQAATWASSGPIELEQLKHSYQARCATGPARGTSPNATAL